MSSPISSVDILGSLGATQSTIDAEQYIEKPELSLENSHNERMLKLRLRCL
jgi:hypothetical protein